MFSVFFFLLFFIVISHSGLCTKRNHHSPGNLTFFYHFIVHFFAMSFLVSASSLNNFLDSFVGILLCNISGLTVMTRHFQHST